ncbi:hypothetical protein KP509_37G015100 [Ceratopteris richardii]|nr:hypothetical protein KP509_1Z292900 [Ceratopteris richardii]KAH7279334.1 hypothetical protein KP509_37G015100 [Ceratopteris richardii]
MAILERMSRLQPQSTVNTSNAPRSNKPGTYNIAGPAGSIPTEKDISNSDLLKRQAAGPAVGLYAHASSLKPLNIDQRPHLPNQFQLRINVPTYLDEFRQGFPSKGLSSSSTQWWGNSSNEKNDQAGVQQGHKDAEASTGQHESQSTEEHRGGCIDDNSRNEATNAGDLTPASMLTRTRKHAVETGKKALGLSITRGYGAYRLADKDEAILRAIFTEAFPSLWEASTAS